MKATAVVLMNNEIVLNAVKRMLEEMGFEVRQDIESCRDAVIGFIGPYFALLGVIRQIRSVNASLPLVLILNADYEMDKAVELSKNFFDVITTGGYNESEISESVARWLSHGKGKLLSKEA